MACSHGDVLGEVTTSSMTPQNSARRVDSPRPPLGSTALGRHERLLCTTRRLRGEGSTRRCSAARAESTGTLQCSTRRCSAARGESTETLQCMQHGTLQCSTRRAAERCSAARGAQCSTRRCSAARGESTETLQCSTGRCSAARGEQRSAAVLHEALSATLGDSMEKLCGSMRRCRAA